MATLSTVVVINYLVTVRIIVVLVLLNVFPTLEQALFDGSPKQPLTLQEERGASNGDAPKLKVEIVSPSRGGPAWPNQLGPRTLLRSINLVFVNSSLIRATCCLRRHFELRHRVK